MGVRSTNSIPFPNPITAGFLATDSVTATQIEANAVTTSELAADAVETLNIKDTQVTTAKLSGFVNLEYVGGDFTSGTIASSVTETTIASLTVSGGTVSTGLLVVASLHGRAQASASNTCDWDLKIGVAASEASVQTFTNIQNQGEQTGDCLAWYDDTASYEGDNNVIITGQNSDNSANSQTTVRSMIVWGH